MLGSILATVMTCNSIRLGANPLMLDPRTTQLKPTLLKLSGTLGRLQVFKLSDQAFVRHWNLANGASSDLIKEYTDLFWITLDCVKIQKSHSF